MNPEYTIQDALDHCRASTGSTQRTMNTNTNPLRSDQRWTVTREFTGKAKPQFVIRFCGDWIDSRSTYPAAVTRAVGAKAVRDGALVIGELLTPNPVSST